MKEIDRRVFDEVRSDGRRWRRLVSRCAEADDRIPPTTEEQYKVVHGRIVGTCRKLAGEESVSELRRQIARQLDELLRPWSSTKSLAQAPRQLVDDLVTKEASLEERLGAKRRPSARRRLKKLVKIAFLGAVVGLVTTFLVAWLSGHESRGFTEFLWGTTANIAARIRQTSFGEQFAVAAFCCWAIATWFVSSVYKS